MSDETSPRPWRVADYPQCPGLADVFDASGSPSGLVAGELKPADASLIVNAVNWYCDWGALSAELERLRAERDRLRDLVRRMEDNLARYHLIGERDRALLREARAAIGEAAP